MLLNKNIGLAIFINTFFLTICLAFSHLRWGGIDDYFMAGILSGIYGNEYNVHLPFVNAIYGYSLLPLYHLFPKISWYFVGELVGIFASFTIFTYILINKIGRNWGCILGVLFVAAYAKDMYVVMQFTQCAAALSAAGMIVLLNSFEHLCENKIDKRNIVKIFFGIAFLWWGAFMRWEVFLMGIPFFAGALLLSARRYWNVHLHVIISLLIVYMGAFAFHEFNNSLYQTPEYKTFADFQPFRVLLGDGAFYNEQAVYEDLQELDLHPKDFDLLKKWMFYDNEVFAPESVQTITRLIDVYTTRPSLKSFPILLLQSVAQVANTPIFAIWLLFCMVLYISNKPKNCFLWITFFFIAGALAYLLYVNRLVYRVEVCLWLYATVLTIFFLKKLPYIRPKIAPIAMFVLMGIACYEYYSNRFVFRSPNNAGNISMDEVLGRTGYEHLFAFMDTEPDSTLFLVPMDTYMDFAEHRLPPYLNEPMGSWSRIVPLGFWTPYFPDIEQSFRRRGMVNPVKDLVKENVYFVSDIKFGLSLKDFLETHHFQKIQIDTVKKFKDISVLKYTVAPKSCGAGK